LQYLWNLFEVKGWHKWDLWWWCQLCMTWKITSQAMDVIFYCRICIYFKSWMWVNRLYTRNNEDMPLMDGGALLIFEGRWRILLMVGKIWWWLVMMWTMLLLIYPTHEKVSLVNLKHLFIINIVTLVCLGFRVWMYQNIDILNKIYTNSFKMLVLFLYTLHNITSLQHYIYLPESFLCMPTQGENT
jgi:hypothetical protein